MLFSNNIQIFCDFDGTITKEDTIKIFLNKYTGSKWLEIEREWEAEKISSSECLVRQLDLIPYITKNELDNFLSTVKIDCNFIDFYNLISEKGISLSIVSDGFDYFIRQILNSNGLKDIKFYANHLELRGGKLSVKFPYSNSNCIKKAGNCKCSTIERLSESGKKIVYIGDGQSDCCAIQKADFIFAKKTLFDFCENNSLNNFEKFENFNDIIHFLSKTMEDNYVGNL